MEGKGDGRGAGYTNFFADVSRGQFRRLVEKLKTREGIEKEHKVKKENVSCYCHLRV